MYSNHLDTGQVCYSNGPNMSACQMVMFSNCETRLKMSALWINVCYSKSTPKHVIRPLEHRTKKCLKSQMFRCQVFGIQMVTA